MSDNLQQDPFDKLFDTASLQDQREILADTVFPFARIDPETRGVYLTKEGEDLTAREKILVFLLMYKVMFARNMVPKEGVSPSELEKITDIPGGTIRPQLRKLFDEKLVRLDKEDEGGYLVPNNRIKNVQALLAKKGSKS